LAIRMFVPELNQCFAGNDVHTDSLSHLEIFDKVLVWRQHGFLKKRFSGQRIHPMLLDFAVSRVICAMAT
jgi:hypothetical protein